MSGATGKAVVDAGYERVPQWSPLAMSGATMTAHQVRQRRSSCRNGARSR